MPKILGAIVQTKQYVYTQQVANLASEIQKHTETNTRLSLKSLFRVGKGHYIWPPCLAKFLILKL